MAVEIQKPNLLVVEGGEEEFFFKPLVEHLGLQDVQVMGIGGKTNLRPNLKVLVSSRRFSEIVSLGVARDANADPTAAFQSVCGALQAVGLPPPELPREFVGDRPRVGVLILPDDETPGMLEDVCMRAVCVDDAKPCVEEYFQCLQRQGVALPRNMSKARVQVFLASRPKAGLRLGEAAQAGYWPWGAEAFGQVKDFLRRLAS